MRLSSSPHSSASGSTATAEFAMAFTSPPRGARLARLFYYDDARTAAHDAENTELVTYVLCTMSQLAA
ncbi:hypothetical protein B7755_044275 [Streptomyces sp. NBS 14/10]|uniref:hypothetical protein n=1 Tax=Streptomyces sp. NBS 14/10 TaxID=1945643 RepID=UPI000B7FED31|nr:hypothetical protein [Streptomyces sp. NBS 14/10]KAK1184497.1 hypothetical protein B7755_044275 [Streptomyces sp. NBS 14/10]